MAGSAFKDAQTVSRVKRSFTPILIDGDEEANKPLMPRYGLHYYPSVVFADTAGNAVETLDGAEEEAFKAAVARLAK